MMMSVMMEKDHSYSSTFKISGAIFDDNETLYLVTELV